MQQFDLFFCACNVCVGERIEIPFKRTFFCGFDLCFDCHFIVFWLRNRKRSDPDRLCPRKDSEVYGNIGLYRPFALRRIFDIVVFDPFFFLYLFKVCVFAVGGRWTFD